MAPAPGSASSPASAAGRYARRLALVVAWLFAPVLARAAKITVGEGAVLTIQEAVDVALANGEPSDVVLVPPGLYTETVTIAGPPPDAQTSLLVRRKGVGEVVVQGLAGPAFVVSDFSRLTLRDLTIGSSDPTDGAPAALFSGALFDVRFERVNGVPGDDIGVLVSGDPAIGFLFDECDFSGLVGIGFWLDGAAHRLTKCRADAVGLNALVLAPGSRHCLVTDFSAETVGALGSPSAPGVVTVDGTAHRLVRAAVSGAAAGTSGFVVRGTGHLLLDCRSLDNGRAGFRLEAASARVENAEASGNLFGLEGGGEGTTLAGGVFAKNLSHGIVLDLPGLLVEDASARNNGGHGLLALPGADRTVVRSSRFKGNGGEGVRIEADRCWLEGNTAKKGDGLVDAGSENAGRDNVVKGGGTNDF